MNLTREQKAIVNFNLGRQDVLKVIAFAGTGKTSTLIEYTRARPRHRFLYIAFNKSVQLEASQKFPRNTQCKTAHSLAWWNFGDKYKHKLVPSLKPYTIMDLVKTDDYESAKFVIETLSAYLVSMDEKISKKHMSLLARQYCKNNKYDPSDVVKKAGLLWAMMCDENDKDVGMVHDGYLKLYQLSRPVLRFDCILLDEAQDTNPVTSDIVLSQSCPKILVGDPHQQIYSFRGARDAMKSIKATQTMYLTHSFRFGSEIAWLANQILHSFKGETQNLFGLKNTGAITEFSDKTYTFIARTNAVVFDEAVKLYKKQKIGFVGGIAGYRLDDIVDTYYLYSKKKGKIKNGYIKSFPSFSEMLSFANTVSDWELKNRCTIVEKYKSKIPYFVKGITYKAVAPERADVLFSTAHKCKGLEFKRVRLANDFQKLLLAGKPIKTKDISLDEFNLIYVSVTRAQEKLEISERLGDFVEVVKD